MSVEDIARACQQFEVFHSVVDPDKLCLTIGPDFDYLLRRWRLSGK
jgi:hypothetical protein